MCSKTTTRGIKILKTHEDGALLADVRVGRDIARYFLGPVPAIYGRGYLCSKIYGNAYAVQVEDDGATCECRGFRRWGHCKHIDVIVALRNRGYFRAS